MAIETLLNHKNIHVKDMQGAIVERPVISDSRQLYKNLKRTSLYDSHNEQWNNLMYPGQLSLSNLRYSADQLLGIFVEGLFDKKDAKLHYEELKKTPLYDSEKGTWYRYMNLSQNRDTDQDEVTAQLMGVLVEERFNKREALKRYESLKASQLYDHNRQQWIVSTYEDKDWDKDTGRTAFDQLLGVLVKDMFEGQKDFNQDGEKLPEVRRF